MRLHPLVLLVLAPGCGGGDGDTDLVPFNTTGGGEESLTEKDFLKEWERKYCRKVENCDGAAPCDPDIFDDMCQYDERNAQLCLDGEYHCRPSNHGPSWIDIPYECSEVFSYCD